MAYFDDSSSIDPVLIIPIIDVTDNTPQVGPITDTNDFGSFTYYISTTTLADGDATFAVTFRHGDASNLSDGTPVSTDDLVGNADFDFNDDNSVLHVGYVGKKRFVEMTITPSNNSGNAIFTAMLAKGRPVTAPADPNA